MAWVDRTISREFSTGLRRSREARAVATPQRGEARRWSLIRKGRQEGRAFWSVKGG
jgi:hypothetical protein